MGPFDASPIDANRRADGTETGRRLIAMNRFTRYITSGLSGIPGLTAAFVIAIQSIGLVAGGAAFACAFHTYKPEKTPIDRVLETSHLVTARADPQNKFAYRAVETLRGGGHPFKSSQLIDTQTRKRLARHPGDAMLFAFDDTDRQWRSVAYLTPEYRRVIDKVLAGMDAWGSGYSEPRLRIAEALQNHPEAELRDLAIRELDKAPYDLLRKVDLKLSTDRLLADLWNPRDYPYQSIRILLLGLSGTAAARSEVHEFIDRVSDWDWANNLGAYSTALVELDGAEGVILLERELLSNPDQPLDNLEQVVEALAIQNGVAPDEVRGTVASVLDRLVRTRPESAVLIARQFGSRNDFSQDGALKDALRSKSLKTPAEIIAVTTYLALAEQAQRTDGPRTSAGPLPVFSQSAQQ